MLFNNGNKFMTNDKTNSYQNLSVWFITNNLHWKKKINSSFKIFLQPEIKLNVETKFIPNGQSSTCCRQLNCRVHDFFFGGWVKGEVNI